MADPVKRTLEELRANGAPEFFERDPAVLKAQFKAKFEAVANRTLYPAQTEMYLIEVAAYALSLLNEAAQTGVLQNTVVFSEGIHLENRAANVSTFRLLAQAATTTIEFRLSAIRLLDTIIPKGTRVGAGNAVTFATDSDLVIPAGMLAATVGARATATGATWNGLGVGKVTDILDPVAFVTSASNMTDISGGTDIEEKERFRLRAANALHTISKAGPRDGYREHVMAVNPEIVDVAVIRPEPGHIDIYPLMKTGLPSNELKTAVLAYLDPNTRRPMGDFVVVHSPEPVNFNMVLTVRVREAAAGQQVLFESVAQAAFQPWTQELGPQIAPSVVTSALKALPRVADAKLTSFDFTDLAAHEFPVLASLVVNIVVVPNE
ncbi:phage baseplate assembly protein [Rhizobium oryzihabitans]|uniref:Phage baseplate assembly protein n=1 Tax=Rhizobium oryzihabitans TaxID=2267833 RepID=A0A7L5BG66_9HYPH|nr:baseplate J/gp47 family protein [Rhizobium oryzihabitans]EGP57880.1 putative bacteriophage baseplate assembly protein [Agrobacterium tumefaciens F2]QIB37841.1 phage baseplate assembly protein [Rhizobium oryzihabitans]